MNADHGLSEATVADIHAVLARHSEVKKAVLYGSRAKGNYKPGSDVDLALFGENISDNILLRIQNDFEDGMLPYRFDISVFSQLANAELIEHIRRVGVIFYEKGE